MFLKITRNTYSIRFTGIQNHVEWARPDHVDSVFQNLQWTKHVFEPFKCEEQEDNERGRELWIQVKRLLNSYGLGTETTDIFEVMLEQLNM